MTHIEKRCHYCGHTYYWQGSGEGCFEKTNNDKYCPRCMEIIIDSLNKSVPNDDIIIKGTKEINKESLSSEILNKMEQLKSEYNEKIKNREFPASVAVSSTLDFDNIEIYHINRYIYYVCWNNDDEENKHYYQNYEYYPVKKKYTVPYKDLTIVSDRFGKGCNIIRSFRNMCIQD